MVPPKIESKSKALTKREKRVYFPLIVRILTTMAAIPRPPPTAAAVGMVTVFEGTTPRLPELVVTELIPQFDLEESEYIKKQTLNKIDSPKLDVVEGKRYQ